MKLTLTPSQSMEARDSLGLSQAAVARETGTPRVYLSQFESGKRILSESQLTTLLDYYEGLGWEPEEEPQDNTDAKPRVRDGLVLPDALPDDEAELYLDAIQQNREKAMELLSEPVPRGLFGGINEEEVMSKSFNAILHLAASVKAQLALQGQSDEMADVPKTDREIETVGQYVGKLVEGLAAAKAPTG